MTTSRLTESVVYRHGWTTAPLDAILSEEARVRTWCEILVVVARCQARLGIIPEPAAAAIARELRAERVDLAEVARRTRGTSHSALGLIEALQGVLPEAAREYVYFGLTVQDLTDTWFAQVMRDVGRLIRADLVAIQVRCVELAHAHRETVMAGRTHGQIGSPITFGLKAATWADEVARSIDRLDEGSRRWAAVQLAGSTGGLAFFGELGLELRAEVARDLGLCDPGISWTATRDRVAEFGCTASMVAGSLARIGNEIYELQRPEIAELSEGFDPAAVGSITMPHKRNPELSEHLDTLFRVARSASAGLVEGLVSSHERDGRSWKAEWAFLPDVALAAGKAAALARELLDGLRVDADAMSRNLRANRYWASEQVLVGLTAVLGKHRARTLLHEVFANGDDQVEEAIAAAAGVDPELVRSWLDAPQVAMAVAMADSVTEHRGTLLP